jgi:two-component system LytT family sensor kinase
MGSESTRTEPAFMHPAIFIGAFSLVGVLFALQEWIFMRRWAYQWNYHFQAVITIAEYTLFYFLWGAICWILWCFLRSSIQSASLSQIVTRFIPLSIATSILQEMAWVLMFPTLPLNRPHMRYWERFEFNIENDVCNSMVIFWGAFFLFRSIGYYQRFREQEKTAAQLEVQLVNAKMAALRMQLNPHFLFNTMNSISSLMRFDIEAADIMLEQLSSLLRITLERGDVQLIPLRDEIDFVEVYLAMQGRRYTGRIRQSVAVDPELHDALVPAMFLQPIVENAFAHGLSKVEADGILSIEVQRDGNNIRVRVLNSGPGLRAPQAPRTDGRGVGLTNVKSRLQLHYGANWSLSLAEFDPSHVQVTILLPLEFAEQETVSVAKYGV